MHLWSCPEHLAHHGAQPSKTRRAQQPPMAGWVGCTGMLLRLVQCREPTKQSAGYRICLILLLLILISNCSCVIDESVTLLALAAHSSIVVLQHWHKESGADLTCHIQRSPTLPQDLSDSLDETGSQCRCAGNAPSTAQQATRCLVCHALSAEPAGWNSSTSFAGRSRTGQAPDSCMRRAVLCTSSSSSSSSSAASSMKPRFLRLLPPLALPLPLPLPLALLGPAPPPSL